MKRSWLSDPHGCTVLTASQLDQIAGDYVFDRKRGRNGILTLELVSRWPRSRPPTYARVAQHVKSSIRTMQLPHPQTPVVHGDSFCEFLGSSASGSHLCPQAMSTSSGLQWAT